jgi:hypothetical protein
LPTLLFLIVLTQACRNWTYNEHGINSWYMINRQVNETVYISHVLIMDCPVNIPMNMDTVNCFWKKLPCIQFSPYAILTYCWCSEYGLSVSTPGPQNLSVFPSNLLLSFVMIFSQHIFGAWQASWEYTPEQAQNGKV